MKKITCLFISLLTATPLVAQNLNHKVTRTVDQAVLARTAKVQVQVKLAKPVRMSDVMFRRPRGKDIIIDWKQKENTCTGTLHTGLQRVYVPAPCVQEDNYQIAQIKMTFPNGKQLQTSAKSVRITKEKAFIALQ